MPAPVGFEEWQVGYVEEQQDRAFRVSRSMLVSVQNGEADSFAPQLAAMTTTLAAQAELIAGMAQVLGAIPEDELEKAVATVRADLESAGGST